MAGVSSSERDSISWFELSPLRDASRTRSVYAVDPARSVIVMSTANSPEVYGLVLAGGASRRMGRDKGALRYHDAPQAVHAFRLLAGLCARAYVSTNARNAGAPPYDELPLIVDDEDYAGPAAGLEAAWRRHPSVAWLALAVDMPLVDRPLLEALLGHRNPAALVTAFRHPDGTIEPLCAIWEPAARAPLLEQLAAGDASLRRFIERGPAELLVASEPERLCNANDVEEFSELARKLRMQPSEPGF